MVSRRAIRAVNYRTMSLAPKPLIAGELEPGGGGVKVLANKLMTRVQVPDSMVVGEN